MKNLPKAIGAVALIVTLASPIIFATDALCETAMKTALLITAIAWFSVAPKIMRSR